MLRRRLPQVIIGLNNSTLTPCGTTASRWATIPSKNIFQRAVTEYLWHRSCLITGEVGNVKVGLGSQSIEEMASLERSTDTNTKGMVQVNLLRNTNYDNSSNNGPSLLGLVLIVFLSAGVLFGASTKVQAATASSSCTLVWTAPGDDGQVGTAAAYNLRYSPDSAQLVNNFESAISVVGLPLPKQGGSEESFTVNDLLDGAVYYFAIKTVDEAGNISGISNIVRVVNLALDVDDDQELPQDYWLAQNYPNPFNPTTTIQYSIPARLHVRLVVYNVNGQVIATLVDGVKSAGQYEETWNGAGPGGASVVASGVYFYRLETNRGAETRKMVLLK